MNCIYCLEDKPDSLFTKTEHVLPQSFGLFKNNFTLNKIVCDHCNEFFGDNLELSLGRDTFEGISRFECGIKKPEDFKHIGKKSRLKVKVDEGLFKGAYAYRYFSKQVGRIVIKLVPQLGFKKIEISEYVYFPLDEIPAKEYLKNNFDLKADKSIVVLGCDAEVAYNRLSEKGIFFKPKGEFYPRNSENIDWSCKVTGIIDQIIFRAIAKIAFNYLTYWAKKDFAYNISFHPIRRYIRYGDKSSYPFVIITGNAILGDEPVAGKRRLGHLITLDWSANGLSIVSQVSIFNWMTYSILLAKDYYGNRINIRKGHFFNIANKEILELEARSNRN